MIKDFIKKCIKKNAIFIAIIFLVGLGSPTLIKAYGADVLPMFTTATNFEFDMNPQSYCKTYFDNYELNYKDIYPYYAALSTGSSVDASTCYLFVAKNKEDLQITFGLSSSYSSNLQWFGYFKKNIYQVTATDLNLLNDNTLGTVRSNASRNFNNYPDGITIPLKTNVDVKFDLFGSSAKSFKINNSDLNLIYNIGDVIIRDNKLYNPFKISEKDSRIPRQIYSVDFYLDPTIDYKYDITLTRANDISNIRASAFKFYGLKENNGLYNWEEINPTTTGCAVEDYTSSYTDNTYNFTVLSVETACNDLILNNTYKDIIFKVIFNNAFYLDDIDVKALAKYIFYNGFSEKHIIQKFDTQFFKYINFSTTLEEYPSYYDFNINSDKIYLDLFDTSTNKFVEYVNYMSDLDKIYFKYYLNIGQSLNRGFWLTYNYPLTPAEQNNWMDFDFNFGYVPDNLYYSINLPNGNLRNDGAIIVDPEGNPIIIDLEPSPDINTGRKEVNNLSDVFKTINNYMRDNSKLISEIGNITNNIFNNLNSEIRSFLIAIYSLLIISSMAMLIRR